MLLLFLELILHIHSLRYESFIGKLSVPFLLCFAWGIMPSYKLPQWLTACSFPIFLMHPIALSYYVTTMKYVHAKATLTAFVGVLGSIAASILIAARLRRHLPRFANAIFGGR